MTHTQFTFDTAIDYFMLLCVIIILFRVLKELGRIKNLKTNGCIVKGTFIDKKLCETLSGNSVFCKISYYFVDEKK